MKEIVADTNLIGYCGLYCGACKRYLKDKCPGCHKNEKAAWCKTIEVFQEGEEQPKQIAIFPEDRKAPVLDCDVVQIRISELELHHPRQWGACYLACLLWDYYGEHKID